MSTDVAELRASSLDVALTLSRAVHAELGGRRLPLRACEGDNMLVVVDSSEAASQFSVGVFITTMSAAIRWFQTDYLPWNTRRSSPERSVSYKKYKASDDRLGDLRDFLAVADRCPGLVLSVASPRLSQSILTAREDTKRHPELEQFRDWSGPDFERLMRTVCAVSIGMEQFYSHPERWNLLHDTDQIFTARRRDVALLWLCSFVSIIRDGELTPIILTTKEEVANQLFAKALLGIADLAAGA